MEPYCAEYDRCLELGYFDEETEIIKPINWIDWFWIATLCLVFFIVPYFFITQVLRIKP